MNDTELITREPLERHFAQVPDDLITDPRLGHLAVRLWCRLDKYAGRNNQAFPLRETLADDLGVSVGGIKRALVELMKAGWIVRKRRANGGSWITQLQNVPGVPVPPKPEKKPKFDGSHMSRPRPTGEPTSAHGRATEGHPPKDTQVSDIGPIDSDSGLVGAGSSLRDDRAAEPTTKKRVKKRKPLTKAEHDASWRRFLRMDLEDLDDTKEIRGAAFLELTQHHGVYEPDKFAADLIDKGQWASFCAAHDLGNVIEVEWK